MQPQTDINNESSSGLLHYSISIADQHSKQPRQFSFLKQQNSNPQSLGIPSSDLMSQARMQQSIEFPQFNSPNSFAHPLEAFQTISQLGGGPQAEAEIMKLRSENQIILKDLKELTSKYNRICQENVRGGKKGSAGIAEEQIPSIQNIVNVAQLLEINALLRAQNTNLIQSQHLIRMINKEQEKKSSDHTEIEELRSLVKRLQTENRQLLNRQTHSHHSDNEKSQNTKQLQLTKLQMQEIQKQLHSTQQALMQQRRSNKHLRQEIAKSKFHRHRSHNSSLSQSRQDHSAAPVTLHQSEKILSYYGKELGRLTSDNQRLTIENECLRRNAFEKDVSLEKLEQQKKFLVEQLQSSRNQVQTIRQSYEYEKQAQNQAFKKKSQIYSDELSRKNGIISKNEEQILQLRQQLEKKQKSVIFYSKNAEETHRRLSKVLDLEEELKKYKKQNEKLQQSKQIMNVKFVDSGTKGVITEMWRLKSNHYVKLFQQLNSLRALKEMTAFEMKR